MQIIPKPRSCIISWRKGRNLCEVLELILESREKGEGAMGGAPSLHLQ